MKYWILLLCLPLLVNCGEPVPIDCTPDQEQCTTENEGGFQTGSAAGIAAGAAGVALLAGGLSGALVEMVVAVAVEAVQAFPQQPHPLLRLVSSLTALSQE